MAGPKKIPGANFWKKVVKFFPKLAFLSIFLVFDQKYPTQVDLWFFARFWVQLGLAWQRSVHLVGVVWVALAVWGVVAGGWGEGRCRGRRAVRSGPTGALRAEVAFLQRRLETAERSRREPKQATLRALPLSLPQTHLSFLLGVVNGCFTT